MAAFNWLPFNEYETDDEIWLLFGAGGICAGERNSIYCT